MSGVPCWDWSCWSIGWAPWFDDYLSLQALRSSVVLLPPRAYSDSLSHGGNVRLLILCVSLSLTHHVSWYWAFTQSYALACCTTYIYCGTSLSCYVCTSVCYKGTIQKVKETRKPSYFLVLMPHLDQKVRYVQTKNPKAKVWYNGEAGQKVYPKASKNRKIRGSKMCRNNKTSQRRRYSQRDLDFSVV